MSARARATARLFVAVDPPEEACHELGGWARAVAAESSRGSPRRADAPRGRVELRPLDVAGLHITLCFLGSRPVDEIDLLAGALASCSGRVHELSVGAPLWLPPRRPHALAVEIHDPSGELERLQRELSAALERAVCWEPGRRRFRAHLTVARIRGRGAPEAGGAPGPATPALRFEARSLTLYRSWLHPTGATYEALATQPLAEEVA